MEIECPHCGAEEDTTAIHNGESTRVSRCPETSEWDTVHKDGQVQVAQLP